LSWIGINKPRAFKPIGEGLEPRCLLNGESAPGQGFVEWQGPAAAPLGPHTIESHHLHPAVHGLVAEHQLFMHPLHTRRRRHGFVLPSFTISGPYTPAQVRHVYGIDQLSQDGSRQTIAIVDAFDDPTISSDLKVFDSSFGLADPPSFIKAVPGAGVPAYDPGWAGEIALDVEWAHAIAPKANILLVEAASASYSDLFSAVDYAVAQGASQVAMSWGGPTFAGMTSLDAHFDHPGVSFLAAAGDTGAGATYPMTSPFVTGIGGTSLILDVTNQRSRESAWGGGGGGWTIDEPSVPYQKGFFRGSGRAGPDVAYDADPATGFLVYNTSSGGNWYRMGGTSAGAPQWAGLIALANQGRAAAGKAPLGAGLTYGTNEVLYRLAFSSGFATGRGGDFFDITSGSNGRPATRGYDLVTGLGSPVANRLIPDLINA
jgi:subtilase family serine protease